WGLLSVLLTWGQRPEARRRALLPALLFWIVIPQLVRRFIEFPLYGVSSSVLWWGMDIGSLGAGYLFGGLLLALGLLTLWRLLCQRLDVRTLPWAWPLGLAVSGFSYAGLMNVGLMGFCFATVWTALFGTAFIALQQMGNHLRDWRQVQWSASRKRWREMLEALPLWTVSWLLAIVAAGMVLALQIHDDADFFVADSGPRVLAACLQVLRDCLILTGFALLAGRLRSPLAGFCIAWVIINIILPLLASGAGSMGGAVMQPFIALMENNGTYQSAAWVSLCVQLALAAGWAGWVFRRRVLGFARGDTVTQG
ncbi:MAG: hypothetical protein LBG66_03400, partial [Gallionellaceae bacterium]|nr:hypothetical protein [Gallionellaceae bacterium]